MKLAQHLTHLLSLTTPSLPTTLAVGFRTVGSSGCAVQMVFIPPNTTTAIFLDNYHPNYGSLGVNLQTGAHAPTPYLYPGTSESVFGAEFDLQTHKLRPLRPLSNTFCSAGAFYKDGTMVNVAGAEAQGAAGVEEGFNKLRTYKPGPCGGSCGQDWVEQRMGLQRWRWYPSAQTLVDGRVVVVGGAKVGGLVVNQASVNEPTYEIVSQDGRQPRKPVVLPILRFGEEENGDPGRAYNLYPILHLLPNPAGANHIFTVAGNQTVIWDYTADKLVKTLPDTPLHPRTFPSSATSVLLPLRAPEYKSRILLCGGSSGDMPNPKALQDCYTIDACSDAPEWTVTDVLPNGPQTMSDGVLLPDGTVLILNGARHGSAGGFMADHPVLKPLIYNASAAPGTRFTTLPSTTIPRLYHSTAILLPSGEVLVAGSNPAVGYSATGTVDAATWPHFWNAGRRARLVQQQRKTSRYPTEYRVEIFAPGYMAARERPRIESSWWYVRYGAAFEVRASLGGGGLKGVTEISLVGSGFRTHGVGMGQRMVVLEFSGDGSTFTVTAPRDGSVMPPGVYMLFVTNNRIPSVAEWVQLGS